MRGTTPVAVLLFAAGSLVSIAPSPAALAQQIPVSAGQRVRVEWEEGQRRHRAGGTVLELRGDSLALTEPAGARTFALARLDRIDLRVARSRPRGAARGAGLGALVGLAVGLAAGGAVLLDCGPADEYCGLGFAFLSAAGLTTGTVVGAVAGAVSPGRRWQRVR
jgi:hypothetical protein